MLQDVNGLVTDTLREYAGSWPPDITDRVFLAIERDPVSAETYYEVVTELNEQGKRGQQVVNQYIGRLVKILTTGVNRGRSYSPRSSLIKSYENH